MAVQFVQPYRFDEQQLAEMAAAGVIPGEGAELVDGIPFRAGAPFRFSSDDYFRLGELGLLHEGGRVELIDGEIIEMRLEGSRHFACVTRLMYVLLSRVPHQGLVSSAGSLFLPGEYRPMPDLMVLRRRDDYYEERHPTNEDALVVIEVSDTSLRYDRNVKSQRYAQAEIPEYWLVDLTRNQVAVHRHPVAGEYQDVRTYGQGESWSSAALGGVAVAVDEILLPR
ncbi:MAG: Uma2 family endonuclease [Thioalkalivibrio sp.]|nr:Uma2 family endonuclease [Thioalkalivibrio sp.]